MEKFKLDYKKYYRILSKDFPGISKEEAKVLTDELFEFWNDIFEYLDMK